MVGRRGDVTMMYEIVISLLLIAFFTYATFTFIAANARGEGYFSRFYALDLGTTAEIVNAGYGDVVLRYDNLKPTLDLAFWFGDSIVAVERPSGPISEERYEGLAPNMSSFAARQHYGKAESYAGATVAVNPVFLIFRKSDGVFAVMEGDATLKTCPLVSEKAVPAANAWIYLDADPAVVAEFKQQLASTKLVVTDKREGANIILSVKQENAAEDTIEFTSTSADGISFSCLFKQQLESATLARFAGDMPTQSGTAFQVGVTLRTRSPVRNDQVAKALAKAMVVYYR